MPVTMTLKNIPDMVYERLKASALLHRRSMNSEAIVCLEACLLAGRLSVEERRSRARLLRSSLAPTVFDPDEIDRLKRAERP
ncbi:MAG: FitA-like ribbon-helix-helix domain-containing protein [bacterium]|jgi:plasmid stability protein|nr:Arc family DNA-binding protein [Betaproteobacteria bacterium]